ncbi:MAG: ATP-binding protein [Desulfovibrionaceae bacterium]
MSRKRRRPGRGLAWGSARENREPGRYFEALFRSLDIGVCFFDASLKLVAVNPAMRMLRGGVELVRGQHCRQPGGHGESPCGACLAALALDQGRVLSRESETIGTDERTRVLEIVCHPLADATGKRFGVAEVARDITWRGKARQDIELANRDIEMLLGSIRAILVTLDGENRVRRFNASAEAAFGLTAQAVAGRDFFDLGLSFEGEALALALADSRARLAPVRVEEIRCRSADGSERLLGLTVNPVPVPADMPGAVPGVLILGQDLAAIKARRLRDSHERRMQAIGRLASGIAHEINTPIQYLGYNAGFLDEAFTALGMVIDSQAALAEAVRAGDAAAVAVALDRTARVAAEADLDYLRQEIPQAIANSRKGIRQVTEIVTAMRQMAHPGTGDKLFFDINSAVRDIMVVTRNAWKNVAEVELTLARDLPLVYGLPQEVSQVLLNVVLNAAQAVEEQVSLEPWTRGRIDIATSLSGDRVVVAVSDTGPGIPEAVRSRIFDPFFTTKDVGKGTGQGLAISQAVMARHGGEIDCVSQPGQGATFFLRFPAAGATSAGSAGMDDTAAKDLERP